jgi:8-oxo-dGTP pyrophosphatase MutT (NUDIX family)
MEKMTNCPCLDKKLAENIIKQYCWEHGFEDKDLIELVNKSFIGWYSRSVAASLFVFCKNKNGSWCVLASERGEEAADFKGYWNCPCGYLDFYETTAVCARRECFEETGVEINLDYIKFIGFEDDPITANRQNVTFRYYAMIEDKTTDEFKFSKANNEGKEVGKIQWIPVEDINNYQWAFGHEKRINEIFDTVYSNSSSYRFWKRLKGKMKKFWWELWLY